MSGKCSDGNLAWIVNLCDESLAESGSANAGNMAAMRKALESFMVGSCVYPCVESCGYDPIDEICMRCAASPEKDGDCPYEKARKALSEPARNCDVGTADEQSERFDKFCDEQCMKSCKACPVYKAMTTDYECFSRWAQMPYEAKEEGNGR